MVELITDKALNKKQTKNKYKNKEQMDMQKRSTILLGLITSFLLFLSSCGGGGGSTGEPPTPPPPEASLQAPQITSAQSQASDSIVVEWNCNDEDLSDVIIEISVDGYNFTQSFSVNPDDTSFEIDGLISATQYFVRIKGVSGENSSEYSTVVAVATGQGAALSCEQPPGDNIYFVDVDGVCGSCSDLISKDDNAINNAWCTIAHAASEVQPGDTIYIRAGEYPESVVLSQSGEDGAQIAFAAYAGEDVILEGGDYINGWTQCQSANDCGGNPNWQNIYYNYIPAENAADTTALVANLFQGDELLDVAQEPDLPDSFFIDDIENYYPISVGGQTTTTLTDAITFSNYPPGFWEDAYALLWVTHNRVEFRKIESYANNTISFAETDAPPYDDRDGRYSIYNGVQQIDNPGEYSVSYNLEQNGTRKVYLWPLQGVIADNLVRFSARNYGININRQSYVTVQGLTVQRYTGSELIHGVGIGSVRQGGEIDGIVIRDNKVRFNRHATRGYGGIYLYGCNDCMVDSNTVSENVRHAGIFLSYPTRSRVKNNLVYKPGQTGIRYYYADQSSITNNEISNCSGSHANTITVYLWSNDVLIANNYIHDSLGYITLQRSNNITIYNNIIDTTISRIAVQEFGDQSSGTWILANNTFINSSNSTSVMFSNHGADYIIKNNILDGSAVLDEGTVDRDNNIYTGLMWSQGSNYGWELAENEIVQEDLSQILTDESNSDYTPVINGYAVGAGQDISDVLPSDIFTDFEFDKDFSGAQRDMAAPSIGAME